MDYPIRCFTCGKVLGNKFEKYNELKKKGKKVSEILHILGITRICCRQVMMCSIDLTEKINKYSNNPNPLNPCKALNP